MKRPTFDVFDLVAQQVVLSVEGSVKIPGAAKKAIAIKVAGELLEDLRLQCEALEATSG